MTLRAEVSLPDQDEVIRSPEGPAIDVDVVRGGAGGTLLYFHLAIVERLSDGTMTVQITYGTQVRQVTINGRMLE